MRTNYFIIFCLLFIFTMGCTTAGSKFIHINYIGTKQPSKNLKIAISPFLDNRELKDKKFIGKRILNSGNEEMYFVNKSNLSQTITENFESYLQKNGNDIQRLDLRELTVENIKTFNKKFRYYISGEIKEFEFFAVKDLKTTMTLDIKLIVHIGDTTNNTIRTIPANLNLKRTDLNFSKKRVEIFMSESITEIIEKSIKL